MAFVCASLPSLVIIYKSKCLFVAIFSLEIAHIPCFKILERNPILTSKHVHENSTTNIEWIALWNNPFIGLGSQGLILASEKFNVKWPCIPKFKALDVSRRRVLSVLWHMDEQCYLCCPIDGSLWPELRDVYTNSTFGEVKKFMN